MADGHMPMPTADVASAISRAQQDTVLRPHDAASTTLRTKGLHSLGVALRQVIELQRAHFKQRGDGAQPGDSSDDEDVPPPADASAARPHTDAQAYFAPGDRWRRPSDFVAHQAHLFEEGLTGPAPPPGGERKKKKLSRDQVLFIAQFAYVCNIVWEDEQADVPMARRRRFSLLLMGQGGSGKTAVVQEVVLPVIDFLFPPGGWSGDLEEEAKGISAQEWAVESIEDPIGHPLHRLHCPAVRHDAAGDEHDLKVWPVLRLVRELGVDPGEALNAAQRGERSGAVGDVLQHAWDVQEPLLKNTHLG